MKNKMVDKLVLCWQNYCSINQSAKAEGIRIIFPKAAND